MEKTIFILAEFILFLMASAFTVVGFQMHWILGVFGLLVALLGLLIIIDIARTA